MTDQAQDKLETVLQTAKLHAQRLQIARDYIEPKRPLTAENFRFTPVEDLAMFELFSSRFAKLQDVMGAKLFGLVLDRFGERPSEGMTYIDRLNALEKQGLIESAQRWRDMREIRNHLSHEYPNNAEDLAKNFNKALEESVYLLECLERIETFVHEHATSQNRQLL